MHAPHNANVAASMVAWTGRLDHLDTSTQEAAVYSPTFSLGSRTRRAPERDRRWSERCHLVHVAARGVGAKDWGVDRSDGQAVGFDRAILQQI